ncbi:auxin response factor 4-like [Bidens hawaiensis]|uniref:auxin response factor 4-like n=1 Tax=Bidens hawaiensis TaxID=980011 RepID=UPI004049B370
MDLSGLSMRLGILSEAFVASTTGCNFSVLYHPRMCTSPYIVPYNIVMEALEMNYVPGMRFEMPCNGKDLDPEHIIRFSGTITARGDSDPVRWPKTEWRCLEVKWDASPSSDVLPSRVSPWEIRPLGCNADQRRSMPFEPVICNIPFSRTNGNNQSAGLQSKGLTHSVFDIGCSSMCTSPFMVPYNTVTEALEMNYVPGMRFLNALCFDFDQYMANPDTDKVFAKFRKMVMGDQDALEVFL